MPLVISGEAMAALEIGQDVSGWEVLSHLGSGSQGTTWEVRNADGVRAAMKHFALVDAKDWKQVELAEREAKVLKHLEHSAIPAFIDAFSVDEGTAFCLVQTFGGGGSARFGPKSHTSLPPPNMATGYLHIWHAHLSDIKKVHPSLPRARHL